MSFLDNLENNLKALESREEVDPETAARRRADAEDQRRQQALVAPHARALRESAFAAQLMTAARAVGHRQRVLVRFAWIDDTLRLEAGTRRLDLSPAADGVHAVSSVQGATQWSEPVDLSGGSAEQLATRWLA